jgi:hypothetical protein
MDEDPDVIELRKCSVKLRWNNLVVCGDFFDLKGIVNVGQVI